MCGHHDADAPAGRATASWYHPDGPSVRHPRCCRLLASPHVVRPEPRAPRRRPQPTRPARSADRARRAGPGRGAGRGERLLDRARRLLPLRRQSRCGDPRRRPAWPGRVLLSTGRRQPGAGRLAAGGRGAGDAAHLAGLEAPGCRARPPRRPEGRAGRLPTGRFTGARGRARRDRLTHRLAPEGAGQPARGVARVRSLAARCGAHPIRDLHDPGHHHRHRHQLALGLRCRGLLVRALRPAQGPRGARASSIVCCRSSLVHGGIDPPALEHVRPLPRRADRRGALRLRPLPALLPADRGGGLDAELRHHARTTPSAPAAPSSASSASSSSRSASTIR